MKTKTRFHKLTAWLLTLAMLMTFIPTFSQIGTGLTVYATEGTGSDSDDSESGGGAGGGGGEAGSGGSSGTEGDGTSVSYLAPVYEDGKIKFDENNDVVFETKTVTDYIVAEDIAYGGTITSADQMPKVGTSGDTTWYVADSDVEWENFVLVQGDVHLVICDDITITSLYGIVVSNGNSLTIYGQENGTGTLVAKGVNYSGDFYSAAIGGCDVTTEMANGGTITINGGIISASASPNAAAIGGSKRGTGGTITINGGSIDAKGAAYSAAIGGGSGGNSGNIIINGGIVSAETSGYSSAIGAGYVMYSSTGESILAKTDKIEINGGTVVATHTDSYKEYPVIGGLYGFDNINIGGGHITVNHARSGGIGIGTNSVTVMEFDGKLNISGGTIISGNDKTLYLGAGKTSSSAKGTVDVVVTGGNISGNVQKFSTLTDGTNNVIKKEFALVGAENKTPVTEIEGYEEYGLTDVVTDYDKLTIYVVENGEPESIKTDEKTYLEAADGVYGVEGEKILSFNANGGTGAMSSISFSGNESKTLSLNEFTRSYYNFTGWNTSPDGNGTSYADGASINITENAVLYAQWEQITYNVTFNPGDGIGTMENDTAYAAASNNYILPECTFAAPEGKLFRGWNVGTSSTILIPGTKITVSSDTTATAVWGEPVVEVTVDGVTTKYPSLEQVIPVVKNKNAEIKVIKDFSLTAPTSIYANKLVIDLNGKTISGYIFDFYCNSELKGPGTINVSYQLRLRENFTMTVGENVNITRTRGTNATSYAVQASNGSTLILNGGSVTCNSATAPAIYSTGTAVVVNADGVASTFNAQNVYYNVTPTTTPTNSTSGKIWYRIDNQITNGNVTIADGITTVYDEKIYGLAGQTVTITPKAGYTLADVKVNGNDATESSGNYTFSMPAGVATLTGTASTSHTHNWNYELVGTDTIKATCTAEGCTDTNGGSVTIAAPASLDYTGEAIEAVVTNNLVDTTVAVNVVYIVASGSELTEGKPVKVGTYTASITLGDATAEVTFEIKPAPVVTSIDFNRESPAYDEDSNTFYVSDDFPFYLTVTGEYLTMLQNSGGLKAAFFGDTQNAGGTWMGMTIDSDTSAHGSYNTSSLFYAINNAGGGATYINSIEVDNKWLRVNLKEAPTNKLIINGSENGSVSHDHILGDDIPENVEVTLKVSPDTGYEFDKLIVDGQNVTAQVSGGKYKFTMLAKDVEVSATFKALPHTHAWEFAANGNVITATCVGTLGVCPNPTSTITLVAPENLVYNGSEKIVTTRGTIDGVTIPDVQYEGDRVNAGTFTAKLTIDNATATLAVTITPKSISGAVIVLDDNANLVYTENAITPDVTSVTLDGTTLIKDTDYTVSYSDNVNAGQATVTITGKGNYKDTANTSFTIEKATPVVTAPTAKAGLTYTGQAHELINAGNTTGGTMQYSLDNVTYSANIPTATNAGTYTVYYKVAGGNNYNDAAASSVEVTIGKQTVNKPAIESKEYTGTELTADVPANELYTVSQEPKTDVGEYDVTLTLKDNTNYKWVDTENASATLKFNITAVTNSWKTEPSISGWTFGQTASTPGYEAKFGTVKVEYKKAEESTYTTTVPTNAGNYTACFSVAATNNYGALEKTVDFTISKAQAVITVDVTPIEKFYGETLTLPEATSNIGTVTVDKTVAQMKDKGTYTVTYTVAGTNNYDGDTKTVNVTIKQLPVNITWENAESLVYDGTQKTITAVLANKVEGDNVNLTVEGVTSATEKGTYTATVTTVDNDNYTITNGTNLTKEWAISETANEWTSALSITGWTFGDNANAPTATAKFSTAEFTYADSIDGAYTDTVPTNAGTYYVKATVAGTSSYAEISATAQFVIEAKELNANNITAIEDKTYTGEEIKPVLEVKDGDTTLVLGTDYEVTYQNNVNADTAKAVVAFKGNYKGNAEKEFTILKKQIDPAITLTAPVKNTAPQTEITGTGYTATVVWSPDVNDKFGYNTEYTATITITVDENHTVTGIAANGYTVDGAKTVTNDDNSNVVTVAYEKTGSRPSSGGTTSYTVKFDTNDGSNVASKTVARNGKVAEPTVPTKDGFTFEGWYTDKELTTAYDFDTKVTKSFTLYAKWNEIQTEDDNKPGTSGHNCPSLKFSDLDITQWYHLDTDYVIENDIFRGTTETTFTPNGNITRAMMITVLYRAEGEPEVTGKATFEDIDENAYYAKAVVWGQQNGIIKGYSETEYAPEQDILREQIAAIMHRYAQYKGYDVSVGENTNILSYDDFDSISEYAIASMQWACGSGLIKGKSERTLNPLDNATRAEIAAILHRFLEANK